MSLTLSAPPNRRRFLLGAAAAAGATAIPDAVARATVSAADRKFVFVFASGGWDPTRVFADAFDNPAVDMEPDADRATTAGLAWIDHPGRPSVRAFMKAHAHRTLVFNGLLVRSIAHEICRMIAMTGDASGVIPDWPAIIASNGAPRTVPSLVLGGPSFPGPLGGAVARTGSAGQLEALVSGAIVSWSDTPQTGIPLPTQHLVDSWANRRAEAQALRVPTGNGGQVYRAYADAVASASALGDLKYTMDFTGGASLADQADVAVDALTVGMSRVVSLSAPGEWDTHAGNDATQSGLFESTFNGLVQLLASLEGAPGELGGSLLDETVVVVLSEMGRTPKLNGFLGKDHWPYTSAMIVGDGVTGGRAVGAFDDLFSGRPVDPATGDTVDDGPLLSAEAFGATLLALADVDPAAYVRAVAPITGVLA